MPINTQLLKRKGARTKRKHTDAEMAEAFELVEAGYTMYSVAKAAGIHKSQIIYGSRGYRLATGTAKDTRLSAALSAVERGAPQMKIARDYCLPLSALGFMLRGYRIGKQTIETNN